MLQTCFQQRKVLLRLLILATAMTSCFATYLLYLQDDAIYDTVRTSVYFSSAQIPNQTPLFVPQHTAGDDKARYIFSKTVTTHPTQIGIGLSPRAGLVQCLYSFTSLMFGEQQLYVCPILKNAHASLLELFCDYIGKGVQQDDKYLPNLDACIASYLHDPMHRRVQAMPVPEHWHKMAIVRDPIDRFISGYTMICRETENPNFNERACYNCTWLDIDCFIRQNYLKMKQHSTKDYDAVSCERAFKIVRHFYPQSWYCSFLQRPQTFELILHRHDGEFGSSMRQWAYDNGLGNVTKNSMFYRGLPPHATVSMNDTVATVRRRLCSSPALLDVFYKTYRGDYAMFNFSLPASALQHCRVRTWSFCRASV